MTPETVELRMRPWTASELRGIVMRCNSISNYEDDLAVQLLYRNLSNAADALETIMERREKQ